MLLWLLAQTGAIPDPSTQMASDAAVVRWALAAVTLSLLGVVVWLMKLVTDQSKAFVEAMKENREEGTKLVKETVKSLQDLSDVGRAAAEAISRKIEDHTDKLGNKIDTNHKEVLDRLRKGGDS